MPVLFQLYCYGTTTSMYTILVQNKALCYRKPYRNTQVATSVQRGILFCYTGGILKLNRAERIYCKYSTNECTH